VADGGATEADFAGDAVITVQEWINWGDRRGSGKDELGWMGGWFNFKEGGKRWKDYIETFTDEAVPYLEAVRADVVAHNRRFTGDAHQHQLEGVPLFSDGKALRLTYRAWGDLMAAIWSEQENKDYHYMNFYM
jgi:hypothetical protein